MEYLATEGKFICDSCRNVFAIGDSPRRLKTAYIHKGGLHEKDSYKYDCRSCFVCERCSSPVLLSEPWVSEKTEEYLMTAPGDSGAAVYIKKELVWHQQCAAEAKAEALEAERLRQIEEEDGKEARQAPKEVFRPPAISIPLLLVWAVGIGTFVALRAWTGADWVGWGSLGLAWVSLMVAGFFKEGVAMLFPGSGL